MVQITRSLKVYLVNLFGMWEVGAPKVGAPSSHVTSLGLLFIGDAPYGFLWLFLVETKRRDVINIRKILKKF